MNIVQMLVPDAYVFPNSDGYTRKFLVLHKTAGGSTAQGIAQYFQGGAQQADGTFAKTSVHYVVGLDGTVVQCVREQDGAGGNCCLEPGHDTFWPTNVNLNLVTFSIECVDPATDNSTPMPTAQKQALFALVKDLCTRQNIPMRPADSNGGIAGHSSIDPISRAHCPGNFAWDELWTYLGGTVTTTIPGLPGWTDDGKTLTATPAPDGKRYNFVQGNRQFVLENAATWDATDVPIEEEHGMPGVPGTQQLCLRTQLRRTPQAGVFIGNVGQQLLDARAQIASLTSQLAAAKMTTTNPAMPAVLADLQAIEAAATDALSKLKTS